jgi:hypothetical protein
MNTGDTDWGGDLAVAGRGSVGRPATTREIGHNAGVVRQATTR